MTWTKIGDEIPDRLAMLGLAVPERYFYIEALVWSNRLGSDGVIPRAMLPRLSDHPEPMDAMAALVKVDLAEEVGDGWLLTQFVDDQWTQEKWLAKRAADAKRKARSRLHAKGDHSMCDYCPAVRGREDAGSSRRESQRDGDRSVLSDSESTSRHESRRHLGDQDPGARHAVTDVGTPAVSPDRSHTPPTRPVPSRPQGRDGDGVGEARASAREDQEPASPPLGSTSAPLRSASGSARKGRTPLAGEIRPDDDDPERDLEWADAIGFEDFVPGLDDEPDVVTP